MTPGLHLGDRRRRLGVGHRREQAIGVGGGNLSFGEHVQDAASFVEHGGVFLVFFVAQRSMSEMRRSDASTLIFVPHEAQIIS